MKPKYLENHTKTQGINTLRALVRAFSACNETFLQRFSTSQLVDLFTAYLASDHEILPDAWDERQITDLLKYEIIPRWVGGTPVYFDNITAIEKCAICGDSFAKDELDGDITCSPTCSLAYINTLKGRL